MRAPRTSRTAWLIALLPVLWVVALRLLAERARWRLGHWPQPYEDDPKHLGFPIHYAVVRFGLLASIYFPFILLPVAGVIARQGPPWRRLWIYLAVGIASWSAWAAYWHFDRVGLIDWLMD